MTAFEHEEESVALPANALAMDRHIDERDSERADIEEFEVAVAMDEEDLESYAQRLARPLVRPQDERMGPLGPDR